MTNPYLAASGGVSGSATLAMTVAANVAVGDVLIANFSISSAGVTSVVDSGSNTWTQRQQNTNNSNCYQYQCQVTTALTAGTDTITLNRASSTGQANAIVAGVPNAIATSPVDTAASKNASGTSAAPSVTTGTLLQATEVLIAMINTTNAGGFPTWGGAFTGNTLATEQAAAGAIRLSVAWDATSATTAVACPGTITSAAWTAMVTCVQVTSGSTPVSGSDTGAGTDTATMGAAVSGADTGAGTDTGTLAATAAAADTGAGTDSATVGVPVSGSDTGAGTDTASAAVALAGADTGAGTDTASVGVAVAGADTGAGTDTGSAGRVSGADTGAGTDFATVVKPAAAFPAGPVGATVELDLAGTWTDITGYVAFKKQLLTITRGHPDESTTTTPSSMVALLDNTSKNFTSKNPAGAYYGLIGRNTPVRVSIPESANYLRIEGDNASYAQAPDSAGLSITGDMDVRIDVTLDNWRAQQILAGKWADTGNERTWILVLQETGDLTFAWSSNGSGVDVATSSAAVPVPGLRRQSLRVTYTAATASVAFYTAPAIGGTWTQLGGGLSLGISVALFNSTAPVQAGYCADAATFFSAATGIYGQVHELIILSGIGGTTKADANYSLATAGTTSYTDPQGNVWTCEGTSEISGRKYRFHGEASAWTPYSEGTLGLDLWCGLNAGGLLRRIQQDTQTLGSAFTRALPSAAGLVGYWPAEDGNTTSSGATPATPTQFASAVQGVAAGTFTGSPEFASDSSFLCAESLPVINGSRWHFRLPSRATKDASNIFRFLLHMPSSSDTNNGVIARMYTTGTIGNVDLVYTTGGNLTIVGYDQSGNQLFSNGPAAFGTNGSPLWASIELQKSGSNVQYSIVTLLPGASSGLATTGTISGVVGNATEMVINGNSGTASLMGTAVGQIAYQTVWESLFVFATQLDAWQGETAGNRFSRLCGEQGIPFRWVGNLDDTVVMGAQTPLAFGDLLQECVDADVGVMYEPRQALALGYRTRASLQNQAAAIALDYSLDGYTGLLTPSEDDQYTKNDVTATRAYASGGGTGSSSEVVVQSGPLSVQAPPAGVGPYLDSVTVNVLLDTQLDDAAGWLAWLGTVNQPRYPEIPYDLARTDIGANLYAVPDLDLGDRLTIGNPPPWEPPDGISQLANQATETIGERSYLIVWTGVPETPYQTGLVNDPVYGRVDTDSSTLHASASSTATSLTVDTAAGTPTYHWTTAAGDFPFDINIGGERITVTNITGTSNPQTFTVTRSVNGVVKAQTAGADVRLFYPTIESL